MRGVGGAAPARLPCRRSFLARAGRASVGLASASLVPWAAACATVPVVTPVMEGRRARIPGSAFSGGGGVFFRHPEEGVPVYVHRSAEGGFTAVLTRCTHRGCEVETAGRRLVCPCHGSEYGLDGSLLQGPAERPLVRYPATADGSGVLVGLDPVQGPAGGAPPAGGSGGDGPVGSGAPGGTP